MNKFEAHDIVGISSTKGAEDFLNKYKSVKEVGATPLLLPPAQQEAFFQPYFQQCLPNVLWLDDEFIHYQNDHHIQFHSPTTLFFTSGSSALPKVVVHSDLNLEISAQESLYELGITKALPIITPLPLWHVGGLLCYYRSLFLGSELILTTNKNIEKDLKLHKGSLTVLVPAQLESLLDKIDLSQNIFYLGGAGINEQLRLKIQNENIKYVASYGMTETAGAVATGFDELSPMKSTDIKIDNTDRLSIKTNRNAHFYIIDHKLVPINSNDGYMETSDRAILTKNGFSIIGRVDQVFISGGENISPLFLQQLIKEIDESIKDVKVISKPHERLTNEVIVFLSPYSDDLKEMIISKLPYTLRPHKVLAWPQHSGIKPALKDFQNKADQSE